MLETVAVPRLLLLKPAYIAVIDPQASTVLVILLLVLMLFSFITSGGQVSYFSLTSRDINWLKTKQQPPYKRVVDLLEEPKALLASLLIANTLFNIAIIIVSNILLDGLLTPLHLFTWSAFIIKLISVVIVLVLFCEVMPRILAKHNSIRFSKEVGPFTEGVFYLFSRPARWMVRYFDIFEKKLSVNTAAAYRREEIYDAIDITAPGDDENSAKEKDILKGIVKFSNIPVKQIMKTRLDVSGVEYATSFKDLVRRIEELHYSRLPVYREDLDEVVGMIHTKDVLAYLDKPDDFDWHDIMRQPYFVHENKHIDSLLEEFQTKRIHFAVVVDEFGGTSGIVTLEDILEEVIGDIRDEFDEEESGFRKIDDHNYIFDGSTSISDVCKWMELPPDTFDMVRGESESLAGLVLEIAGEIPQPNEVIKSGDFDFTVVEAQRNRLKKIKITIRPEVQA